CKAGNFENSIWSPTFICCLFSSYSLNSIAFVPFLISSNGTSVNFILYSMSIFPLLFYFLFSNLFIYFFSIPYLTLFLPFRQHTPVLHQLNIFCRQIYPFYCS